MRIVQIGAYPLSSDMIRGGVEASVYGLAHELGKSNEVHVFDAPRKGGEIGTAEEGNVLVHRIDNPGRWQVSAIRQTKKMTKEIMSLQPDVCHVHGTNLFAWKMYKRLKKEGLPCVVTVHGLARVEKKNALKNSFSIKGLVQYLYQGWVEKRFLGQLPMVIVDTEYVNDMINSYPIRRKPMMYVVPQGIDEDFYGVSCSQSSRVILSVGAIGNRKGHLLTLRAFERLREEGFDAQLVIAGIVAEQDYLGQLQSVLFRSKYKEGIRLCANLPKEDLRQLYQEAHLFVLHSEEESQGIVFAEAMATGMPIVATRVGGIPFVVAHGKNGLLSGYGDVKTFAENIGRLMKDQSQWQAMSDASRILAQNYHWTAISASVMRLYQSVVEKRN